MCHKKLESMFLEKFRQSVFEKKKLLQSFSRKIDIFDEIPTILIVKTKISIHDNILRLNFNEDSNYK